MSGRSKGLILIWIIFGLMAASIAYLMRDNASIGDQVLPMGNDSFYHARRMIDTATGPGFYEFDERMHVPEGSWVTWPWAYDFLAGKALAVALFVNPTLQPMVFLGWIPVLWVFLNAALFLAIAARLELRLELIACAGLAFGLSAAIQGLHGFAIIDHHFIELSFVLAATLALMRWLGDPDSRRDGAILGVVLGLAPAFHTGAFILQLPVLITLFILWLRDEAPPAAATRSMAVALLITTLLILLPSGPFRDLQFSMTTLSWFHGYVAVCTAIAASLMAWKPISGRQFTILAAVSAALGVPLVSSILLGSNFLSGKLLMFDRITEVRSPVADLLIPAAWPSIFSLYSWLFLLLPFLIVFFAWQLIRKADPVKSAFYVSGIFGLIMLSLQQRLLYFGLAALILGSILLVAQLEHFKFKRAVVGLIALVGIAISVQPQLRGQLFAQQSPGFSRDYEMTYSMYAPLAEACDKEPGLMIAGNNDGHPIRFHTECSVLANNFILTPLQEAKTAELLGLLDMQPAEFLANAPAETRYVFLRLDGLYVFKGNRVGIRNVEALRKINSKLFMQLAEAKAPVPGFELLAQMRVNDARDLPIAQLYRVSPGAAAADKPIE